ncbi:MAG: cation:proton antiporter domain-containing protein [Alphaproteobacteria bacterium]
MPIDSHSLRELIVFLIAAGVVVPLASRFRISPVLGFLIVGLVIGPFGLVRFSEAAPWLSYLAVTDVEGISQIGELGVVFLLFMIGLELSVSRLWAMRRLVFGLGGAQVLLTGSAIALVASLFDNTRAVTIVLGASFALSSTAIVMQLLVEKRRLGTETGRISFAILLFQDLAVLPILFLVAALAAEGSGSPVVAFAWAIGQAVIAVAVIYTIGQLAIRPLFRLVGSAASREMFLALVLLVIIGTAFATEQAGLSMALGAFLAGLMLAETEYRHEIEVDIEPFKGLLLGLFFVSVGMAIDVTQIAMRPFWLFGSVVGLFAIKGAIIYLLARFFGTPRSVAAEAALLLGQGGEFAFIVVGLALTLHLMPEPTVQFMLIVASLTMVVTPLVANLARRVARRIEASEGGGSRDADIPIDISNHIVIAGYGRVGQMLGSILDAQEISHIGLDINTSLVASFRAQGACVFYGDASRPELLRKFDVADAGALVVTIDNPHATERVVAAARRHWPKLAIYARARDVDHARRLIELGATHVTPEAIEASLQLGETVLIGAGFPEDAARHMIEIRRQEEHIAVENGRDTATGSDQP